MIMVINLVKRWNKLIKLDWNHWPEIHFKRFREIQAKVSHFEFWRETGACSQPVNALPDARLEISGNSTQIFGLSLTGSKFTLVRCDCRLSIQLCKFLFFTCYWMSTYWQMIGEKRQSLLGHSNNMMLSFPSGGRVNLLKKKKEISRLIKTITKFANLIGYRQARFEHL